MQQNNFNHNESYYTVTPNDPRYEMHDCGHENCISSSPLSTIINQATISHPNHKKTRNIWHFHKCCVCMQKRYSHRIKHNTNMNETIERLFQSINPLNIEYEKYLTIIKPNDILLRLYPAFMSNSSITNNEMISNSILLKNVRICFIVEYIYHAFQKHTKSIIVQNINGHDSICKRKRMFTKFQKQFNTYLKQNILSWDILSIVISLAYISQNTDDQFFEDLIFEHLALLLCYNNENGGKHNIYSMNVSHFLRIFDSLIFMAKSEYGRIVLNQAILCLLENLTFTYDAKKLVHGLHENEENYVGQEFGTIDGKIKYNDDLFSAPVIFHILCALKNIPELQKAESVLEFQSRLVSFALHRYMLRIQKERKVLSEIIVIDDDDENGTIVLINMQYFCLLFDMHSSSCSKYCQILIDDENIMDFCLYIFTSYQMDVHYFEQILSYLIRMNIAEKYLSEIADDEKYIHGIFERYIFGVSLIQKLNVCKQSFSPLVINSIKSSFVSICHSISCLFDREKTLMKFIQICATNIMKIDSFAVDISKLMKNTIMLFNHNELSKILWSFGNCVFENCTFWEYIFLDKLQMIEPDSDLLTSYAWAINKMSDYLIKHNCEKLVSDSIQWCIKHFIALVIKALEQYEKEDEVMEEEKELSISIDGDDDEIDQLCNDNTFGISNMFTLQQLSIICGTINSSMEPNASPLANNLQFSKLLMDDIHCILELKFEDEIIMYTNILQVFIKYMTTTENIIELQFRLASFALNRYMIRIKKEMKSVQNGEKRNTELINLPYVCLLFNIHSSSSIKSMQNDEILDICFYAFITYQMDVHYFAKIISYLVKMDSDIAERFLRKIADEKYIEPIFEQRIFGETIIGKLDTLLSTFDGKNKIIDDKMFIQIKHSFVSICHSISCLFDQPFIRVLGKFMEICAVNFTKIDNFVDKVREIMNNNKCFSLFDENELSEILWSFSNCEFKSCTFWKNMFYCKIKLLTGVNSNLITNYAWAMGKMNHYLMENKCEMLVHDSIQWCIKQVNKLVKSNTKSIEKAIGISNIFSTQEISAICWAISSCVKPKKNRESSEIVQKSMVNVMQFIELLLNDIHCILHFEFKPEIEIYLYMNILQMLMQFMEDVIDTGAGVVYECSTDLREKLWTAVSYALIIFLEKYDQRNGFLQTNLRFLSFMLHFCVSFQQFSYDMAFNFYKKNKIEIKCDLKQNPERNQWICMEICHTLFIVLQTFLNFHSTSDISDDILYHILCDLSRIPKHSQLTTVKYEVFGDILNVIHGRIQNSANVTNKCTDAIISIDVNDEFPVAIKTVVGILSFRFTVCLCSCIFSFMDQNGNRKCGCISDDLILVLFNSVQFYLHDGRFKNNSLQRSYLQNILPYLVADDK